MILGLSSPKFVGTGIPDTGTMLLDYSVYKGFNLAEPRLIQDKSPLTGKKNIVKLGDWASFSIIVYLFQSTAPQVYLAQLMNYRFQNVIFYPHRDKLTVNDGLGLPILDVNNNPLQFFIAGMKYSLLNNYVMHDIVEINFISTNYVKKSGSIV